MIAIKHGPAWPESISSLPLAEQLELSAYLFIPSPKWELDAEEVHVWLEYHLLEMDKCKL